MYTFIFVQPKQQPLPLTLWFLSVFYIKIIDAQTQQKKQQNRQPQFTRQNKFSFYINVLIANLNVLEQAFEF